MARTPRPEPLVSNAEVAAATKSLNDFEEAAGRTPTPDHIVRFILEEAGMVRLGKKLAPIPAKAQ